VGEAVANAAKEGDFMGIGGKKVSDAAIQAHLADLLAQIKGILGSTYLH
jgi:hypothetical protein